MTSENKFPVGELFDAVMPAIKKAYAEGYLTGNPNPIVGADDAWEASSIKAQLEQSIKEANNDPD